MKLLYAALAAGLLAQQAPPPPLVFGPQAAMIRPADIEAIALVVAPYGGSPWLLTGFRRTPETRNGERRWIATAYLVPSTATPELRRGSRVDLTTEPTTQNAPDPNTWRIDDPSRMLTWAQVSLPGRPFDDVKSESDENLPLTITGKITDADLVSSVRYIRSGPSLPRPAGFNLPAVPGPVRAILAPAIMHPALPGVRLTLGLSVGCFYDVVLERRDDGWVGSIQGGVGCR